MQSILEFERFAIESDKDGKANVLVAVYHSSTDIANDLDFEGTNLSEVELKIEKIDLNESGKVVRPVNENLAKKEVYTELLKVAKTIEPIEPGTPFIATFLKVLDDMYSSTKRCVSGFVVFSQEYYDIIKDDTSLASIEHVISPNVEHGFLICGSQEGDIPVKSLGLVYNFSGTVLKYSIIDNRYFYKLN